MKVSLLLKTIPASVLAIYAVATKLKSHKKKETVKKEPKTLTGKVLKHLQDDYYYFFLLQLEAKNVWIASNSPAPKIGSKVMATITRELQSYQSSKLPIAIEILYFVGDISEL